MHLIFYIILNKNLSENYLRKLCFLWLYLHLRTEYSDTLLITSFLIVQGINILKLESPCKITMDRCRDEPTPNIEKLCLKKEYPKIQNQEFMLSWNTLSMNIVCF